jgi:hypothetical protein
VEPRRERERGYYINEKLHDLYRLNSGGYNVLGMWIG